jgi:CBS domain-containing protein
MGLDDGGANMSPFTLFHVVISLVGIVTGLIVVYGFLSGYKLPYSNALFLVMTIATSVTGFFFPYHGITPGIVVGVLSLIILALALLALSKRWTKTYIVTCSVAEFFNVLVLIVQSFQKIPALHAFAPTGKEPIVAICQGAALVVFAGLAVIAIRKRAFVLA